MPSKMTNQDKQMPDELYVYNDKSSIGDFGFTSMSPKYGYIKYNRASPHQCCGAVGKEACTRYDQDGEECDVKRAVIDDGLLAEAIAFVNNGYPTMYSGNDHSEKYHKALKLIITHALKSREKVGEVTIEWLVEMDYMEKYNAEQLFKACPNGIKIVDGGA